ASSFSACVSLVLFIVQRSQRDCYIDETAFCSGCPDAGVPVLQSCVKESMSYFLAKTDPDTYSIDDLEREHKTAWDGVTNPQAVRTIREMRPGDRIFLYHSGGLSAVVGMATVRSESRPDPKNPKSAVVDLEFTGRLDP